MQIESDFIKYLQGLEDLKNLQNISPKEYDNTKTEILDYYEQVRLNVLNSDILGTLKKKILKNLESMQEHIERMFSVFDASLKETEETFDKDLLIAKVEFSLQKIQEHYQRIVSIVKQV